jgi:hypothetical protein
MKNDSSSGASARRQILPRIHADKRGSEFEKDNGKTVLQMNLVMSVMIAVSFLPIYQKETAPLQPTQTTVEVWCGGDDALTQGVCYALESAFESTADFVLSNGKRAGTLVVTIPTNVDWKESGKRTRVFYTVEFTTADDKKLRTRKGKCWNDDFARCANQIVKQARIAVRKVHTKH